MKVTERMIKQRIHQSNLIEGFDDPRMDAQGFVAWNYISDVLMGQLDHHCIMKVQKMITLTQPEMQPDWRGYYRKIDVWIGSHKGMAPEHIRLAMDNLLSIQEFTHPHTWHVEFEKIHPFVDGNGRTGRMIMWWMQMQRDEKLTYISFAKRADYYRWFR